MAESIEALAEIKGQHTELVSVYVPADALPNDVAS
jgi:peptide subunit release factor 1 (eRF1)